MDGSPADQASGHDRTCPHCGDRRVHRWGKPGGTQRYRCRNCGRTFNALTGTACAGLRRPELWVDYRAAIIERLSIRKAAKRYGIDPSTALRWRRRLAEPAAGGARPTAPDHAGAATGDRHPPLDFVEWVHAMRATGEGASMRAHLDGMFGLGEPAAAAPAPARKTPRGLAPGSKLRQHRG